MDAPDRASGFPRSAILAPTRRFAAGVPLATARRAQMGADEARRAGTILALGRTVLHRDRPRFPSAAASPGSLHRALQTTVMRRARLARSPEALPRAISNASAHLDAELLGELLAHEGADALVVDRERVIASAIPRTSAEVRSTLGAGHTLVVRRANARAAALRALADEAAAALEGTPDLHVIVKPVQAQSLRWHHESEDVVILQARGANDYVFRQGTSEPLPDDPFDGATRSNAGHLPTCTLVEGDLLYIPRGWWHLARSRAESWSISIGVRPGAAAAA
jgi:ribosomal protein L16 Arg81 hydroxylase